MERLTERTESGELYLTTEPETDLYGNFTEKGFTQLDAIYHRLAAYEDTGLAPGEIPHWIPVNERMPEKPQDCLCYFRDGSMAIFWSNGKPYKFHPDVTHWMHLTRPPKEEK